MEFQKISSPSLRELFVDQLEHMILSGKLKIGEKLPPERQLAEMMQVSRAVVNSGISELEKKVEKHNKVMERTFVLEEQIKVVNHRLSDLEAFEHETEKENRGVG